jgi:hypothetical protein
MTNFTFIKETLPEVYQEAGAPSAIINVEFLILNMLKWLGAPIVNRHGVNV